MTKNAREEALRKQKEADAKKLADRLAREKLYWDPMEDKNPGYMMKLIPKTYTADFDKAIQNLNDILIDTAKFDEMNQNVFKAMDEDNLGYLQTDIAEEFIRRVMKGTQIEGMTNTDFEDECEEAYVILREKESGEVDAQEMAEFMQELIFKQITNLQNRAEQIKYQRSIENQKRYELEKMKLS